MGFESIKANLQAMRADEVAEVERKAQEDQSVKLKLKQLKEDATEIHNMHFRRLGIGELIERINDTFHPKRSWGDVEPTIVIQDGNLIRTQWYHTFEVVLPGQKNYPLGVDLSFRLYFRGSNLDEPIPDVRFQVPGMADDSLESWRTGYDGHDLAVLAQADLKDEKKLAEKVLKVFEHNCPGWYCPLSGTTLDEA